MGSPHQFISHHTNTPQTTDCGWDKIMWSLEWGPGGSSWNFRGGCKAITAMLVDRWALGPNCHCPLFQMLGLQALTALLSISHRCWGFPLQSNHPYPLSHLPGPNRPDLESLASDHCCPAYDGSSCWTLRQNCTATGFLHLAATENLSRAVPCCWETGMAVSKKHPWPRSAAALHRPRLPSCRWKITLDN